MNLQLPLLEAKQVLAAFLGAALALAGQWFLRRLERGRTAKAIAIALWEELNAVQFYGGNFAGFSSQTFDSLFRDLADTLPPALSRSVMRYHWRMKYLQETKSVSLKKGGNLNPQMLGEAQQLRAELLPALQQLSDRSTITAAILLKREPSTSLVVRQ